MRFDSIISVALLFIAVSPAEAWLTWLPFAKPEPAQDAIFIEAQEPTLPPQKQEDVGLNQAQIQLATIEPTTSPLAQTTDKPSVQPSGEPSMKPSRSPTLEPSHSPTSSPITNSKSSKSPSMGEAFDQGLSDANEEEGDNHIFQCPLPRDVGCTAVDFSIPTDECSTVGNRCNSQHAEYCCLDACSRKYCTAKGMFVGLDGNSMASGGTINKPQALHDKATTFTGQPISIDVLFNDFVHDPSSSRPQQHSSEDGTNLDFGTTSLELKDIVTNGIHGTCTIQDNKILYTPDDGYAGPDKCGYRVCEKEDATNCNIASISITIAKQSEEVELEVELRPDLEDFIVPLPVEVPLMIVDPDELLTEEVWNEVDESNTVTEEETSTIADESSEDDGSNNVVVVEMIDSKDIFQVDESWDEFKGNCDQDEVLISFELQTDFYGDDVTWELIRQYDSGNSTVEVAKGPYNYGEHTFDQVDLCVPSPSVYIFRIYDNWGDGLCDQKGCGYYKLFLDGREIVYVTHYAKKNTHVLNLGYDSMANMTQREIQYLNAHNRRRKKYHTMYNTSYVPLIWSPKLAEESSRWADELLNACDTDGIEHEPHVPEGENLAKNKGLVDENGLGWGQLFSPEKITRRWVEREIGWAYPDNAHLTQALWRASKYLGCGEAEKPFRGGMCRVQVCRYAKAGNCDMKRYNSTEGENWLIPMLKDSSPCEPSCAPEGCF